MRSTGVVNVLLMIRRIGRYVNIHVPGKMFTGMC